MRPLSPFTGLAPDVTTWMVGGHPLGGVRAADDAEAVVLFASYCATDIARTDLPVLGIAGADDGLSTAAKIADSRHLLPEDAWMLETPGAAHSSFGDYGLQGRTGAVVAGSAAGFMHVASGLSGPALAAYAVGSSWKQRDFAASVQVIFVAFSAVSVALRGLPVTPVPDVGILVAATAGGILVGSILARNVPARIARLAMLAIAWAGATVVFVRGILSLVAF